MIITVELSFYPLTNDFEGHIIEFIQGLKSVDGIEVTTNSMSSYLSGDSQEVFRAVEEQLRKSADRIDTASLVMKVINRKLPTDQYLDI